MVDVNTQNKTISVNVSSSGVSSNVNASGDTTLYYSNKAREWAISNRIVDGVDYSSKYYANKSNQSALNAQSFAQSAQDSYNNFQQSVDGALSTVNDTVQGAITTIDTKSGEAIDNINNTKTDILTDIEFVADGEKEEIKDLADVIKDSAEDIINRVGISMFDTKISDHILEGDLAKGWALQGTYIYKEALAGSRYGYPDFYAKCIEEYNQATTTETVNGATVKVNANGHKFYNISDKTAIDEFFNSVGSAWFYGVDIENERIFLPRDKYFAIKSEVSIAGNGLALGLTSGHTNLALSAGAAQPTANYGNTFLLNNIYGKEVGSALSSTTDGGNSGAVGVTTDAIKSGIEGKLTPNTDKYLYICVGNTINYEGVADVVNQGMEILEQVNQGIESRVKLDGSNAEFIYVTEAYQNGTSWYRVYSDGWCIQGGVIKTASTSRQTINLLKAYRDTNYSVFLNIKNATGNGNLQPFTESVNNLTTKSFTVYCDSLTVSRFWQTSGYIY